MTKIRHVRRSLSLLFQLQAPDEYESSGRCFRQAGDEDTILKIAAVAVAHHMDTSCKHLQVRVVAREDDIEFVECQLCGEVFDANEFHDMEIEEKVLVDPEDEK